MKFFLSLLLSTFAGVPATFGKLGKKDNPKQPTSSPWMARLNTYLLRHYVKDDQTVAFYHDEPMVVSFWATLHSISKIKIRSMSLSIRISLHLSWVDPRLTWNPKKFGGLNETILKTENIWIVPISFENSIQLRHKWHFITMSNDGRIEIRYDGSVRFSCKLKSSHFPQDKQICSLILDFCPYSSDLIQFKLKPMPNVEGIYPYVNQKHSADDVINHTVISYESKKYCTNVNTSTIEMFFAIQQRNSKYGLNIIFPSFLMSLILVFSFILPSNSQEKMGVANSVIFGHSVYITYFEKLIPETNSHQVITAYITALVVVDVIGIISSAFIINIHHFGFMTVHPPTWILSLCMKLRRPLFLGSSEPHPPSFHQRPALQMLTSTISSNRIVDVMKCEQNYLLQVWARQEEVKHILLLVIREWEFVAFTLDRIFFILHSLLLAAVSAYFVPFFYETETVVTLPGMCLEVPSVDV